MVTTRRNRPSCSSWCYTGAASARTVFACVAGCCCYLNIHVSLGHASAHLSRDARCMHGSLFQNLVISQKKTRSGLTFYRQSRPALDSEQGHSFCIWTAVERMEVVGPRHSADPHPPHPTPPHNHSSDHCVPEYVCSSHANPFEPHGYVKRMQGSWIQVFLSTFAVPYPAVHVLMLSHAVTTRRVVMQAMACLESQ